MLFSLLFSLQGSKFKTLDWSISSQDQALPKQQILDFSKLKEFAGTVSNWMKMAEDYQNG